MFRYVALVWKPAAARHLTAARRLTNYLRARPARWREAPDQEGVRLFYRDARPASLDIQALPIAAGLVAGAVFERNRDPTDDSPARRWIATATQAEAIVSSRGRWLIENCWGNYVAIIRDPGAADAWVLKGPTGELPCLATTFQGVAVIFSCIGDLVDTGLFQFTVRRSYTTARVLFGGVAGQDSLEGVEEICRGECVRAGDISNVDRPRCFYWRPSTFADSADRLEDRAQAAVAMRATVRSCTHSWAQLHDSVVHRLSGGLDSSIIAGCLRDAPNRPRFCSYTYYDPRARAGERPWARLAAKHAGCEHIESPVEPKDIRLELILDMPLSIYPVPVMGYLLRSTLEQTIASERSATAVFCGDGGDSGFGGEAFAYALSDYLRRHGVRGEAFRLAVQIARLTGQSIWAVLGRAVRRAIRGDGMEQMQKILLAGSRLLSPHLREACSVTARYPHPWFGPEDRTPWSTMRRLGMLLAPPQFYDVVAGVPAPEVVAPLYSQPAIELFLRIPLYRHFENGRERGLARRAFAGDAPAPVLQRLAKDRAPGFHDELIKRNRVFLREFLLDGVLVRERLLDRAAIEQALSERLVNRLVLPGEVLRHIDVEVWARRWSDTSSQPVRTSCQA